jgi:hypothetical protein
VTTSAIGFDRLIEIPEEDLVKAVFADNLLLRSVGIPPSIRSSFCFALGVAPQQVGLSAGMFGDADALLIEQNQPGRASVIEFKRVKISPDSFRSREPSKLSVLKKAGRQANALYAAGFAHVWITVIIVADMRPVSRGNTWDVPPLDMVHRVYDSLPMNKLAPEIGVTVCEIAQISDQPANHRGSSGGRIIRSATTRDQPAGLTGAIDALFSPRTEYK